MSKLDKNLEAAIKAFNFSEVFRRLEDNPKLKAGYYKYAAPIAMEDMVRSLGVTVAQGVDTSVSCGGFTVLRGRRKKVYIFFDIERSDSGSDLC